LETEELHNGREISIWIDNYDDIFSDFDPRLYSERNISEDFLYEVKRISQEEDSSINKIRLLVPQHIRRQTEEEIINKRLHTHFKKYFQLLGNRVRKLKLKSVLFVVIAIVLMTAASYLTAISPSNIFLQVLLVIIGPAGWFLMFTGLDNLINISKVHLPDLDFYRKITKSKIVFESINSGERKGGSTKN
jgi:hypothetical protein